ncbi:protein PROCA1 [Colius striatus]|uniref:protein PROCA1 n=1 Tax=Colius striatus TaxID=57412 RepID=UPI002B1E1968|nr:protein PROCA1 [Colius striatus]
MGMRTPNQHSPQGSPWLCVPLPHPHVGTPGPSTLRRLRTWHRLPRLPSVPDPCPDCQRAPWQRSQPGARALAAVLDWPVKGTVCSNGTGTRGSGASVGRDAGLRGTILLPPGSVLGPVRHGAGASGPARYRSRHITPPAATATGPGPAGRGDPPSPPSLRAAGLAVSRGCRERPRLRGSLRAAPGCAGDEPPRVGGLRGSIRQLRGGGRRGAMCAPGLLCRLLLLLLLPLAAAPGAAPGTAAARTGRPRARRGLTYPGTLWCGAGSNADAYEELGEHRDTDRCCRDHDHCQHVIHPFTLRYGYRNLRWHTISHCDCDHRLKECLQQVNDTASRVVGQAFFNVIQVPCFEFAYKEECVEPYLYVWCKTYNTVAIAVPREPVLYEFGGELIDRAARPEVGVPLGPPWSSTGGGAVSEEHHPPARPLFPPKAAKKERKGKKKDKKKKGKGLKQKSPSKTGELRHSTAAGPMGLGPRAPPPDLGEAANAILSDAPAQDPSPVPTASGKRKRKERNRKKRLKSRIQHLPAKELLPVTFPSSYSFIT